MNIFRVLFLAILLTSCSTARKETGHYAAMKTSPRWFPAHERFASKNKKGEFDIHPFFDYPSGIFESRPKKEIVGRKKRDLTLREKERVDLINAFILTPADTLYHYEFDLLSGKKYKKFEYCKRQDAWGKVNQTIFKNPFSIGIVPRVLDQLGTPFKVYVFGGGDYFHQFQGSVVHQVRIIGGFVEQNCSSVQCFRDGHWRSRLVLLAVDPEDQKYGGVRNGQDLFKLHSWDFLRSSFENTTGVLEAAGKNYPVRGILGFISKEKSIEAIKEKGYHFKRKELNRLRYSCYKLYDYIWEVLGPYLNLPESEKKIAGLAENFLSLHQKYGKRFSTCQNYVRAGNLRHNQKRHWLFSYLSGIYRAKSEGLTYDCQKKRWRINPVNYVGGEYTFNFDADIKRCHADQIYAMFPKLIFFLKSLVSSDRDYFRYIEYDEGIGGSHERLHSWVPTEASRLSCHEKASEAAYKASRKWRQEVFPVDVLWPPANERKLKFNN